VKIAIILPNWLGDLVMATPVLRAVRRYLGPDGRLVGIMRPHFRHVLDGTGWLDEQWYYDRRSKDQNDRMKAVARRMRRERFDVAVLLTNSLSSAVLAWRGGAKERVGFVRYGRGPLLTRRLLPRRDGRGIVPEPMVNSYLALAEATGCPKESPRLELATTPQEERMADETFAGLGLRRDGRIIVLNPGGAYGKAKLWPAEHFGVLARRIAGELDHDVLVMCGPKERDIARTIVRHSGGTRVFSMADQEISLRRAKGCIRRGRLMVSTDSGPRHIAAAFGKPVVTLFGPTLPVWVENPAQRAVNLVLDGMDCAGCGKRVCPLGHHACMRNLKPDLVFQAVSKQLEEEQSREAA